MTPEDAYALYESVRAKNGMLRHEFEADEDLISGTLKNVQIIVEDQSIGLIKPPTAYDAVQNARDHILTDPRISVPVRPTSGPQEASIKTAEKRQQFHQMWWGMAFSHCGDPLGRGKGELVLGKMVLKVVPKFDAIPDLPENPTRSDRDKYRRALDKIGRNTFLWDVTLCPKESVYEIGDPHNPDAAFEEYKITRYEAEKRFGPLPESARGGDPLDEIDYVEYWEKPNKGSRGQLICWVGNEVVKNVPNPLCNEDSGYDEPHYSGRLPYVFAPSGWGSGSPSAKPEERYVSIIKYARSVIEAECRFLTMTHEAMKYAAFKPTLTKNIPDAAEKFKQQPGAIWETMDGQEVGYLDPGEIPASLFQGMARVNQYIDQTSKFSTLGGMPQRGVDTATEADQNIRNAATKLSAPITWLRWAVMKINEYVAWDVENVFEAPVTLYGALPGGPSEVTLTPSDINGFYMTYVELETSDEAALNLRNVRTWSDLAQRMPISFKTVMQKAGIQNATREMDERLMENLEQSEPVTAALLQIVLSALNNPMQAPTGATPPQQPNMPALSAPTGPSQAQTEAVQAQPERQFR